jgi:hypothetical protein
MAIEILLHTPTYTASGCVPRRAVLARKTIEIDTQRNLKGDIGEYVTWIETLDENDPTKHTGFCWGHYFPVLPNQSDDSEQYIKACADYAIRVVNLSNDPTNKVVKNEERGCKLAVYAR